MIKEQKIWLCKSCGTCVPRKDDHESNECACSNCGNIEFDAAMMTIPVKGKPIIEKVAE